MSRAINKRNIKHLGGLIVDGFSFVIEPSWIHQICQFTIIYDLQYSGYFMSHHSPTPAG